jgi:hypothetical protein
LIAASTLRYKYNDFISVIRFYLLQIYIQLSRQTSHKEKIMQ